jgi:hypothetical protein
MLLFKVLDTNTYINGPKVHEFQKSLEEYLDVKHVIPCANGTDALQPYDGIDLNLAMRSSSPILLLQLLLKLLHCCN